MNFPQKLVWTTLLALLALLGNYFRTPLFFGLDLIWGTVPVLLALVLLGWRSALLVGLAGAAYTLVLWGHPYSLIIYTLEPLAVALLRRRLHHLVLADAVFWLVLGGPLVLLSHAVVMDAPLTTGAMIAFKQVSNGIFNALLAGLAVLAWRRLWPGRIEVDPVEASVGALVFNAFLAVGMFAAIGSTMVYSHRSGQEQYQRVGHMLEAVARRVVGPLEREGGSPQDAVDAAAFDDDVALVLLAPSGRMLARRGESHLLAPGTLVDLGASFAGLRIWLPPGQMSAVTRWQRGYFTLEVAPPGASGMRVMVEGPAAPVVARMEEGHRHMLGFMTLVSLVSVLAAWLLSRWLTRPLVELEAASRLLPARIMAGEDVQVPFTSRATEFDGLRRSLQTMVDSMAANFREVRGVRESLARQVMERTRDLAQREEALRRSKQLLDSIIEHLPVMVFVKRATDLRFEIINRAGEKLLGHARADLLGKNDYDLVPRGQADAFVARDRAVLASGQVLDIPEEPVATANGQIRYLHTQKIGLRDSQGVPSHLLGIAIDVTERRESERTLAEFKSTLDRTLDGVFLFDAQNLRCFYANQGAVQLLGYTREALLQMHAHDLVEAVSAREFRALLAPLVYGERDALTQEAEFRCRDGWLLPVEVSFQYIVMPSKGQAPRFVAIVRDIRERKRAEQIKRELIAVVNHALRAPLTSLAGALSLAASGRLGDLPPPVQEMMALALRNSQRLARLLKDLQDMEQLDAGTLPLDCRVQLLAPLVRGAVAAVRDQDAPSEVDILLQDQAPSVAVRVDGDRLQQALGHFLANAVRFSPVGGRIAVRLRHHGRRARVEVIDQGPGVPDQFRERVFQPFAQAEWQDARHRGGVGLGLAISKALVGQMGGVVGFEPGEGGGACFYCELPVADEDPA